MSWRTSGMLLIDGCSVRIDYNESEGLYRATLDDKVVDFSSNPTEVRRRLADKLENLVRRLRS